MKPKTKKILFFTGLGLDVAIMIFLLVVAIIMLATMPSGDLLKYHPEIVIEQNGAFIGTLQTQPTLYLCTCVVPLIVLFILNIIGLIYYVKKAGTKKAVLSDLSEEQKAAIRAELLKEMQEEQEKK